MLSKGLNLTTFNKEEHTKQQQNNEYLRTNPPVHHVKQIKTTITYHARVTMCDLTNKDENVKIKAYPYAKQQHEQTLDVKKETFSLMVVLQVSPINDK